MWGKHLVLILVIQSEKVFWVVRGRPGVLASSTGMRWGPWVWQILFSPASSGALAVVGGHVPSAEKQRMDRQAGQG